MGFRARFRAPPKRMPRRARRERGLSGDFLPSGVCVGFRWGGAAALGARAAPPIARAPESAARPFRAPGDPGGGEAVPRASWRLIRDPRNVRRLGVIRGTAVYGFIPGEDYRMRVLVCLDTLALSSPPERHKHTPWPPHARRPPPSPQTPPPGQRNGVQHLLEGPFSAMEGCVPQSPSDHAAAPREPPRRRPRRPGRPEANLRPTVV